MTKALEKEEGRRLATLSGKSIAVTCVCGHQDKLTVERLSMYFDQDTRLKDVIPRLLCTACGKRDAVKAKVVSANLKN